MRVDAKWSKSASFGTAHGEDTEREKAKAGWGLSVSFLPYPLWTDCHGNQLRSLSESASSLIACHKISSRRHRQEAALQPPTASRDMQLQAGRGKHATEAEWLES